MTDILLWIAGIGVTCGIGCIVANVILWWRSVKRSPGAAWWTRI